MSSALTATPPRRHHDLAAHSPATPRPSASASSMTPAAFSSPLALDSLLAAHAAAPDPPLAALDQLIPERNTLSSQNAQLWKVIEKSRAAYIEAQKNLDRVRSERDAYKSRLHALGENTDAVVKSYRERDKVGKAAAAHGAKRGATATASPSAPRPNPVRHQSDETGSSHSLTPSWSATRPTVTISPSGSRSPEGSPVATRADSVPTSATHTHKLPPTRPLQIPKSASLPPSSATTTSPNHPGLSPFSELSNGSAAGTSPAHSPADSFASNTDLTYAPSPSTLNPQLQPQPVRPSALSRESRISLPDEARQYISAMGDSPLPSPQHPPAFHNRTHSSPRLPPAELQPPRTDSPLRVPDAPAPTDKVSDGEFLDMDDDSLYEASQERGPAPEGFPEPPPQDQRRFVPEVDEFPLPPTSHAGSSDGHSQSHARSGASHEQHAYLREPVAETPTTPTAAAYNPHASTISAFQSVIPEGSGQPHFRALPLLPHDLPRTRINVTASTIRPNDRGKDVLSFVVVVAPGSGKEPWAVEKLYSDVLGLDQRVRARYGKNVSKRVPSLPDGKLWKDHAPSKVDQRKSVLEKYVQALIDLPVKSNDEIIAFLTSDIIKETNKPVSREGYKEGYLTKRGKNFGGWKTRFFVVQGPSLEYYENRGGTHLGSIPITGAQIGRQQRPTDRRETEEEGEYRHAFLIIEPRRGAANSHRHVLCAESDQDRDDWVDMLVRYVSGSYNDEAGSGGAQSSLSINTSVSSSSYQPRSSTSSSTPAESPSTLRDRRTTGRATSLKDEIAISNAVPIAHLAPDSVNAKLFHAPPYESGSPVRGSDADRAYTDAQTARRLLDKAGVSSSAPTGESPLSSSLPTPSPLDGAGSDFVPAALGPPRANSELGHYPDLAGSPAGTPNAGGRPTRHAPSPERTRQAARRTSFHPKLDPVQSSPVHATTPEHPHPHSQRAPSPLGEPRPDMNGKVKISGPMNGTPIPAGYKFGGKDAPRDESAAQAEQRRDKAKSRMFGWGWRQGGAEKPPPVTHVPRAVFGVTIEESLEVAQIASLPSIVFRCIQYLEAKEADQEEGIYRLSGSSAVIKSLKDKFNAEGDVDLLASDEFWDPHAIAGLLKTFFRDLPHSILTRDLHMRFLAVMDPQERILELSRLIAMLPLANYSLLRALTAHLILIVQNAHINKMTMRNVGIVFSPTLGIPAGVFSLMLGEFNRVFNVEDETAQELAIDERGNAVFRDAERAPDDEADLSRRNSRQYTDAAADQLLGLAGRKLSAPEEDGHSDDGEELSLHDGSGTETTETTDADSGGKDSPQSFGESSGADQPQASSRTTRIAHVAATRGLNIRIGESRRHSRAMGLPLSPRPSPAGQGSGSSGGSSERGHGHGVTTTNGLLDASPMQTPR
ncbi:RhoGAP-domain-containing protein [Auriscalpium vulgare]|uniref:RhoGAP-domain-containing protein n=1 Tax=Auriscalpium vulgare TaxID=40419 RepID=A0ACB8RTS3_9AGAM|nr:RhoGAP-domain-containing protein [Auriscalpium vulgare]